MADTPDTVPTPGIDPRIKAVQDRIIQALSERGGANPQCPICRKKSWMVGNFVPLPVSPTPLPAGGVIIYPNSYPCVALICRVCGNTQLINLYLLGFTEEDQRTMGYPSVV